MNNFYLSGEVYISLLVINNHMFIGAQKCNFKVNKSDTMSWKIVDGRYSCEQCLASYSQKYNLLRHLREECGQNPIHKCPLCPYRAKRRNMLKTHVLHIHKVIL